MSKTLSKKEIFGILQQSKDSNHWTVPAVASANFRTIQWINSGVLIPDPAVTVDQFNVTSQNGTHSEHERFFIDATSGLQKIPFTGTCDKTTMAAFLVAALQACSEAVLTPFTKTITAGGLTGVINWANNEGYLFTLALKQSASADDGIILENALINDINIVWEVEANGVARLVNMSGNWIGNELNYEQALDGTWTNGSPSQAGFYNNTDTWAVRTTFTVGGVDYSSECIRRVELQINNNITKACVSTGGKASNYNWNPEYKTLITLDHNPVTEKLLKDFTEGADVSFIWSNDAATANTDGKWTIQSDTGNGKLMSQPKTYDGDYLGIQLEIKWHSLLAATPLVVAFTDTIDWGF